MPLVPPPLPAAALLVVLPALGYRPPPCLGEDDEWECGGLDEVERVVLVVVRRWFSSFIPLE